MKTLPLHAALGLRSESDAFKYLISTLSDSVRQWDYFVDWKKVFSRVRISAEHLSQLNSLVGSQNFDVDFVQLLTSNPQLAGVIPSLLGNDGKKSKKFSIATDPARPIESRKEFDFSKAATTPQLRNSALEFVKMTGLINIFTDNPGLKLEYYLLGVETGLDSNGRKNRGGTAMEVATEALIRKCCESRNWEYITQASKGKIFETWGVIPVLGEDDKRYDYAIYHDGSLALVETNFYGFGGSKLKATAEEYSKRQLDLQGSDVKFVWITDGQGWAGTQVPLRKAFGIIDFIFNLELLANGALEEALEIR